MNNPYNPRDELVAAKTVKNGMIRFRYNSGFEETVNQYYAYEQVGETTNKKITAGNGEWVEL